MICTKKKTPPSCRCQGTAVGSIFLVISGESLSSIFCPSAVRAWQGMASSQLGCSGQAEDRCSAALGSSCPNLSDPVFYPGCDSNPPGGTHRTERAQLSPEGTCKTACCQPGDVHRDHGSLTFALSFQDEKYSVTVYKSVLQNGSRCWEHLAGLHSHYKPIRSILFGVQLDSSEPRLLSLGEDRQLVGQCESLKGSGTLWVKWGAGQGYRGRHSVFGSAAPNPLPTSSIAGGCFSAWSQGRSAQGSGLRLCYCGLLAPVGVRDARSS